MKKVVVEMDSFKACPSSTEVEKAAEEEIKQRCSKIYGISIQQGVKKNAEII